MANLEEINATLDRIAANQARHDELHERHKADIAEIDRMMAMNVESLNRHDRQLDRLFEAIAEHDSRIAEHAILFAENEKRFAELAETNKRLEGSYELLESFVRGCRVESHDYFAETDRKLARLADVHSRLVDLVDAFIKDTNERFAETANVIAESGRNADDRIAEAANVVAEFSRNTDERIKALIESQVQTAEMVRALTKRNGSTKTRTKKLRRNRRRMQGSDRIGQGLCYHACYHDDR